MLRREDGHVLGREDGHVLRREDGHVLGREDGHVLRREDGHALRITLEFEVEDQRAKGGRNEMEEVGGGGKDKSWCEQDDEFCE